MGASGSKEGTAPDKVDVLDFHAVKATLDDYSVELLKKAGYSIDHRLDDMQMGIAIVAVRIRSVRRRLSARGVSGEHSDPLIPPVCQALDRSIARSLLARHRATPPSPSHSHSHSRPNPPRRCSSP